MDKPYTEENKNKEISLLNYIDNYNIIKTYYNLQNIFNINIEVVN